MIVQSKLILRYAAILSGIALFVAGQFVYQNVRRRVAAEAIEIAEGAEAAVQYSCRGRLRNYTLELEREDLSSSRLSQVMRDRCAKGPPLLVAEVVTAQRQSRSVVEGCERGGIVPITYLLHSEPCTPGEVVDVTVKFIEYDALLGDMEFRLTQGPSIAASMVSRFVADSLRVVAALVLVLAFFFGWVRR